MKDFILKRKRHVPPTSHLLIADISKAFLYLFQYRLFQNTAQVTLLKFDTI